MVKKRRQPASEEALFSKNVRRTAVSLAVAAALPATMVIPAAAVAQESESDSVIEEVITYGRYRQSLLSAMETKRMNSSIVESISAEDIGKLPDVSIAESLSRLPGVAVQRLNGRGQVVNLRGMSPDFNTGLLNGREQVSVGDNRGVEFDQYPSELLQQVVVYKTPDAALIGQGLSGTIDLRTVRPLEFGEQRITFGARINQTEYDLVSDRDDTGQMFSGTYIDQFADGTVGLVIGAAHSTNPAFGRHSNAWGYYVDDGSGNAAIGGGRLWARASELERTSFTVGLDFRPNDRLTIEFDGFISEFEEDQIKHGFVLAQLGDLVATEVDEFLPGIGIVTAGSYNSSELSLENNVFLREADLQSFGANFSYDIGGGWVGTLDLSHSSIDRADTAEFESNSALNDGTSGTTNDVVTFRTGRKGTRWGVTNDYTNLDYNTTDALHLTSPYGWGDPSALAPYQPAGQFGYNKVFDVEDDINAFRLELGKDLEWGIVSGVEFGYNFSNREKSRVANEGVITSGQVCDDPLAGDLCTAVQLDPSLASTTDLSWGMLGGDNTRIVSYDPYKMLGAGLIQQGTYLYDDILSKAWVVDEDVHTLYAMFEVDTMVGNMTLSGNFGLQWQSWDQASNGNESIGAGDALQTEQVSDSADGDELLPSLNLSLGLTDNQILRFGYARTLARPRMDEMKASGDYNYDVTNVDNTAQDVAACINQGFTEIQCVDQLSPWDRTGGNTQVEPWIADAFDLSYEYYFEGGYGYAALALFYKDLDTYVFDQTLLYDFTGLPPAGPDPQLFIGTTTSPQNGKGGSVDGWEFALQLDFGAFTRSLEGLGFTGTYSENDSDIEPNGPGSGSRLPGLSDEMWNLTVYYERGGFSARVNQRYRSGYVGEVAGFGGARTGSDIEEETVLDAQIGYEFLDGPLSGLSLYAQGLNLTDEPFQTIYADIGLPNEYQTFGATYQIGFTYNIY